ncbi:hypothetical protein EV368DRAFT_83926 [Lentinula lateritia]|nr:hypothetical protein EV368DRAFT_83926 [Lentinula lateritia]
MSEALIAGSEGAEAPIITTEAYKGVLAAIKEHSSAVEILDNLEEVQDNVTTELPEDDDNDDRNDSSMDLSELMKSIKEVSKGVSEKTSKDCDEINLDGSEKDKSKERSTFTHAQKMRAAATFGFGRIHGLGMLAWHRSEYTGKMLGNPSVSETLTSYMLSLRRRKTLIGETATSARAVTSALLSDLFEFNNQPKFAEPRPYEPTARNIPKDPTDWGGCRARALLHLGYTLAFCDLLRIDELLKIQVHDIVIEKDPKTGVVTLTLTLPFRKTSQFGGM